MHHRRDWIWEKLKLWRTCKELKPINTTLPPVSHSDFIQTEQQLFYPNLSHWHRCRSAFSFSFSPTIPELFEIFTSKADLFLPFQENEWQQWKKSTIRWMSQTIHLDKVEISALLLDFVDLYGWGVGNIMGKFRDISIFLFIYWKSPPPIYFPVLAACSWIAMAK